MTFDKSEGKCCLILFSRLSIWLYAEKTRVSDDTSLCVIYSLYDIIMYMSSNNSVSGENQQERLNPYWLVGFTDGEGCFSISIFKNKTLKSGYQIFPEFVLTQGAKSLETLEKVKDFFKCGKIYENKRYDNHRESLYKYCVRNKTDLITKICPFFNQYTLQTAKRNDFELFKQGLEIIKSGEHLTNKGFMRIQGIASEMNRKKPRI